MFKMAIEHWTDEDRELGMWLFTNDEEKLQDGRILVDMMASLDDFIPRAPLLLFPIHNALQYGQVYRNVWLIKPMHMPDPAPDIFVINARAINAYSGHEAFFKDPSNAIHKLMNLEVLQALHQEKNLHIAGYYQKKEKNAF